MEAVRGRKSVKNWDTENYLWIEIEVKWRRMRGGEGKINCVICERERTTVDFCIILPSLSQYLVGINIDWVFENFQFLSSTHNLFMGGNDELKFSKLPMMLYYVSNPWFLQIAQKIFLVCCMKDEQFSELHEKWRDVTDNDISQCHHHHKLQQHQHKQHQQ